MLTTSLLILAILLQSWGKTAVLVHFYSFRKAIVEKECVNRIRPVTMCYGSCVLAKKMETGEAEKKTAPLPPILKTAKENILFNETTALVVPVTSAETGLFFIRYTEPVSAAALHDIFHPPATA